MKILLTTRVYPPYNNDGSNMLHDIALYLKSVGHQVRVLHLDLKTLRNFYVYEGTDVFADIKNDNQWQWADVFITHLHATNTTIAKCKGRPVFHIIHSELNASYISQLKHLPHNHRIIYNSNHLLSFFNLPSKSIVVNPPAPVQKYNVNSNPFISPYITLINLNQDKGGKLFYQLAKAMPDHQFMGVLGGSGAQIIEKLPNVKIVLNSPDIQKVYKETRLLLDFFQYESWGKVATEAICNGIPVISVDVPGLRENLSYAGTYINDRENIEEWVEAIKKFDQNDQCKMYYRRKSGECRKRAKELGELSQEQLANLDLLIQGKQPVVDYKKEFEKILSQKRPVFKSTFENETQN